MFWLLLIGLYILTFPINFILLGNVWYRWYPISIYEPIGEKVDNIRIKKAPFRAIFLFGLVQPFVATIPLLYGDRWYHYLICFIASVCYAASGSAKFFLDRVRSSHLMRLGTLLPFTVGTIVFSIIRN